MIFELHLEFTDKEADQLASYIESVIADNEDNPRAKIWRKIVNRLRQHKDGEFNIGETDEIVQFWIGMLVSAYEDGARHRRLRGVPYRV